MTRRRYQGDALIAEYIDIAFDELKVFRGGQWRLLHQGIDCRQRSHATAYVISPIPWSSRFACPFML